MSNMHLKAEVKMAASISAKWVLGLPERHWNNEKHELATYLGYGRYSIETLTDKEYFKRKLKGK